MLAEWETNSRSLPTTISGAADLTVAELILRGWNQFISQHYRDAEGKPTNEQENFRKSLKPLRELYGQTLAREFGPLALKAVRSSLVEKDWSRK